MASVTPSPVSFNVGIDSDFVKAWPSAKGQAWAWDEQADFIRNEIQALVSSITDEANPKKLTNSQGFQMMRMFRVSAAVSKNGVKWRSLGQISEVIGAMCSAAVPVFVGVQTQFTKEDDPIWFWLLNLSSIFLSLVATLAVAIERVRGMKEQGVIERLEGADIMLELKKFVGGSDPYNDDYRKNFPKLSAKVADIQHRGTADLYSAFKSRSADKTSELMHGNFGAEAQSKEFQGQVMGAASDLKNTVKELKEEAEGAIASLAPAP